jgi:hypothetical protein
VDIECFILINNKEWQLLISKVLMERMVMMAAMVLDTESADRMLALPKLADQAVSLI